MKRVPWLIAGALLLAGCTSGPAVDGSCDVTSIEAEIEALIAESHFVVQSYESIVCAGQWAYVVGQVGESGSDASEDHFLMRRDGDIWVLKSPESACVEETLPPEISAAACSAGA